MKIMEKIYEFFAGEMPTPPSFGWFHFMWVAIMIGLTVFMCIKFKNCSDKTFRTITLIGWILIVVLEIYKQIIFTFNNDSPTLTADYQWYAFPFQLCSSPLYVLPFIAFMKDGKIRDMLIAFISTFSLFGGLIVFIYPNDVFIELIGINIQTMVHHGLQIVFGIFYMVYNRKKTNFKYFLGAIPVFVLLSGIAILLNETLGAYIVSTGEDFSMFYISSLVPNHLPILSDVYKAVPWGVFLIAYLVGFCLVSALIYYIMVGIMALVRFISSKTKNNTKVTATENEKE